MIEEPRLSAAAIAAFGGTDTTQTAQELAIAAPAEPETEPDELSPEEVRAEIERMIGPGIGGYTVEAHGRKWGPFGTAEEAAQWAVESLPDQLSTMLKHIDWIIRPFTASR